MTDPQPAWHALFEDEVLGLLQAGRSGLQPDDVQRRLTKFGPNSLPPPGKVHPVLRFLAQFNSALIYFCLLYTSPSPRD